MPDIIELPEDEVIKKYHELKNAEKVGKYFNVSITPILRILNKHNIERYKFKGLSGKDNPNYGNKWTDEMKKKISQKRLGKTWEEIMGKERANELKEYFSDKYSGSGNPFYGKTHSNEFKKKSSKRHKGKTISKKHKEANSKMLNGRKISWNKKISKTMRSNYSEDRKKKASELMIKRLSNGEFKKINTSIELKIKEELNNRGILFIHQFKLGNFLFDFAVPDKKILIECDGDFFHCNPNMFDKKNPSRIQKKCISVDIKKKEFAEKEGWILLRFWEEDIKKNVKSCVDKIEENIKNAR